MNKKHLIATILSVILVAFILPATTLAAPPANDYFGSATVISALPFSDSVDNTEATTEPGEQQWCNNSSRTVWYSFTPAANAVVRADMVGSSFGDTNLTVYQATVPGIYDLNYVDCASWDGSSVIFSVQAGTTYYIQAGDIEYYSDGGGNLVVNLEVIQPPSNDDFVDATPILELPFSDTVDTAGATTEPGEPVPSCAGTTEGKSVWYAFTPSESGSVSASASAWFSTMVAAYTGDSLANLEKVGCNAWGWGLTFHVDAGITYYFQSRGVYNDGGSLQFNLIVPPPPSASFYFDPYDPSVFDTVQFYDSSYDPIGIGIESQAWDFGDGSIATGQYPNPTPHRYAADGDYTVQLTVTTYDGRTASTFQLVKVRTHDVAITRFSAPQAVSAGQTRQISVGINSKLHPETVQVQLFKSVAGGFEPLPFGSLTQFVPVRPSNRTTDFNFSYTFTNEDAIIGKVTFKAVATITNARDALPADNEAIASPTKVSKRK